MRLFFLISRILASHYRHHSCCHTEVSCLLNTTRGKLFSINSSADRVCSLLSKPENKQNFLTGGQACLCSSHNFFSGVFRRHQVPCWYLLIYLSELWVQGNCLRSALAFPWCLCLRGSMAPISWTPFPPDNSPFQNSS